MLGEADELVDDPFGTQVWVNLSVKGPILEKLCNVQTVFFKSHLIFSLKILDQCTDDGFPTLLNELVRGGFRLWNILPEDVGEVLRNGLAVRVLGKLHQPFLILV